VGARQKDYDDLAFYREGFARRNAPLLLEVKALFLLDRTSGPSAIGRL
jgi:hypothetical protein